VFVLDNTLTLDPGADRQTLLDAMNGHIRASVGEVVAISPHPSRLALLSTSSPRLLASCTAMCCCVPRESGHLDVGLHFATA
jgi:hypothetical protein